MFFSGLFPKPSSSLPRQLAAHKPAALQPSERQLLWSNLYQGQTLRLWYEPDQGLVGSVGTGRHAVWLGPEAIRNALKPQEDGRALLQRLGGPSGLPAAFILVYRRGQMFVAPPLRGGAGPDDKRVLLFPDDFQRACDSTVARTRYREGLKQFTSFDGRG